MVNSMRNNGNLRSLNIPQNTKLPQYIQTSWVAYPLLGYISWVLTRFSWVLLQSRENA